MVVVEEMPTTSKHSSSASKSVVSVYRYYRTGGKFRAIQDFALFRKISRVLIPPSTCIIFVSSTHEKREIKNTSKFSTRTVYQLGL